MKENIEYSLKKIGNIVFDGKSNGYGEIFNVVNDYSQIDENLPTLIIGYEKASGIIGNFSILEKKYNDGMLQWTFLKTERRNDYINDLDNFKEFCIMRNVKKTKYTYIDIINYSYSRIKKLIKYINSIDNKLCFVTKNSNFVFIYSIKYDIVWGLSLTLCDFCGIDKQKILNRIRKNSHNRFIKNIGLINDDVRKKLGENTHYLLPTYLYFE